MREFAKLSGLATAVLLLLVASPLAITAAKAASELSMTSAYLIAQGDRFAMEGEYEAARAEYEVVAELLHDEGKLPVKALRRIATTYYFEGEYERAAATLDRLADEAVSHGDLATRGRALADAAYLARLAGNRAEELRRREKLALLLSSPELADAVRDQIRSKVNMDLKVFAPHLSSR